MRKLMLLGCVLAAILSTSDLATAGPVPVEGQFTIPAAATAFTNPVALTAGSYDIERIVLYNSGAVTCAVAVAADDLGVFTAVDTFALAAGAGASQYPPGRQVIAYETVNLFTTGDVFMAKQNVSTNWVPFATRDLRMIGNKATNATDVVIYYRIFAYPPVR